VAFVVPAAGAPEPDVAALDAHCRARLARFKAPEEYRIVEALPKTSIGKTEKKVLRAQLARRTGDRL
jgi:acyl-CoA synthetase (AMP-forming)/AMP-acid ligase II